MVAQRVKDLASLLWLRFHPWPEETSTCHRHDQKTTNKQKRNKKKKEISLFPYTLHISVSVHMHTHAHTHHARTHTHIPYAHTELKKFSKCHLITFMPWNKELFPFERC